MATWRNDFRHGVRMVPHLQFQVGLDARPDARVVAFTAAVALVAGVLFSLAPTLRASRFDIAAMLASVIGDRRRTSKLRLRVRDALVVSQIAMRRTGGRRPPPAD